MSDLRKAAQQALEALEEACGNRCNAEYNPCYRRAAADNLRAALAQPEQEPVLWMMPDGKIVDKWALQFYGGQAGEPLYKAPPQRKPLAEPGGVLRTLVQVHADGTETWQEAPVWYAPPQRKPLTEEEIVSVLIESAGMTVKANDVDLRFARAIERAHGIE